MKFDFDKVIDRRGTGSLKWDVPENELPEEIPEDTPEEAAPKAEVNVNVNLDAEYFHWKEGGEASGEKKPEKHSFFSRHHKE